VENEAGKIPEGIKPEGNEAEAAGGAAGGIAGNEPTTQAVDPALDICPNNKYKIQHFSINCNYTIIVIHTIHNNNKIIV